MRQGSYRLPASIYSACCWVVVSCARWSHQATVSIGRLMPPMPLISNGIGFYRPDWMLASTECLLLMASIGRPMASLSRSF
jgi:hypothetical protein